MPKCKITVEKMMFHPELAKEYEVPDLYELCPHFEEGQTFEVDTLTGLPEGFGCSWAWTNIHPYFVHLMLGGTFSWSKDEGSTIACCSDPVRPVVFKLERIED